MSSELTIWALKIQPGAAEPDTNPYEFCKNHDPPIIGMGWGLKKGYQNAEEALEEHHTRENHRDQWENVKFPIRAMLKKASVEDLVWVNEESEYALCKIESDWKQHPDSSTSTDEWTRHDIHNYRIADWRIVDPRFVPGYVKRYYSAPRIPTMARPDGGKNEASKTYAQYLYERNPDEATEVLGLETISSKIQSTDITELFNLLDPIETEDIVIDYLQSKGWHVIKSSASKGQPGIECVLRRVNEEPESGYVQVKSGDATIAEEDYAELANDSTVYLHQRHPPTSASHDGVEWIKPEEVKTYLEEQPGYLPGHTLLKLGLAL